MSKLGDASDPSEDATAKDRRIGIAHGIDMTSQQFVAHAASKTMIESVSVQPYEMILDQGEFGLRELADVAIECSIRGEDVSRELPDVEL
jgi:hypothetical protein